MKNVLFLLLLMPCWCLAQQDTVNIKLPLFEPQGIWKEWGFEKDNVYRDYNIENVINSLRSNVKKQGIAIDSLQKELLECQEKSKVDELIIERLFEGMKENGVTVPTTLYTATYDSLGNIYFKEK